MVKVNGYGPGCPLSRACCVLAPRTHHTCLTPAPGSLVLIWSLDRNLNVPQVDDDTVLLGLWRGTVSLTVLKLYGGGTVSLIVLKLYLLVTLTIQIGIMSLNMFI